MLRYTHELKPGLLQLSFVRRHRQLTSTTTVCTERSRQVNHVDGSLWTHLTCSAGIALAACPMPRRLQTGHTDVQVVTRLRTVVSLRCMQVSAWGQSPSPLVWHHHMRHTVWTTGRLMSPDRGFGTSCLLHCGYLTVTANSEDSWKRFRLSRTRPRRIVTLAFRRQI